MPGTKAKVLADGTAAAPESAPAEVKKIIASGNEIAKLPYKSEGGHSTWRDTGYDCTGSTTYALRTTFRAGRFPTFGYSNWQLPGPGKWVTTYASSYHVYMIVAGLRFDTSGLRVAGSRWTPEPARRAASSRATPSGSKTQTCPVGAPAACHHGVMTARARVLRSAPSFRRWPAAEGEGVAGPVRCPTRCRSTPPLRVRRPTRGAPIRPLSPRSVVG